MKKTAQTEEDDVESEESILDVLEILHELQKRRIAKSSSRLAAIEAKKKAIIETCTMDSRQLRTDTSAYIDSVKISVQNLLAMDNIPKEAFVQVVSLFATRSKAIGSQTDHLAHFLSQTSPNRTHVVEANSTDLTAHTMVFKRVGRKVRKRAQRELESGLEAQRIATEAHAYIKYYKHLVQK